MFNNISYNVIIERFKVFAEGHYLIKRFTHGQVDQTDLDKDQQFPWMHVAPVEVRAATGARVFTFDVIFADIPRDKEDKTDYQKESISDCIRLAEDLLSEIQNGLTVFGPDVEIEGESTLTPFIEEWTHTLSGCTLALTISVPNDYSACDIPADWAIGGGSSSTPPSPLPGIILRVNTVDNVNQHLLDLTAGANVTITDLGDGRVKFDATGDLGTNWGTIGGLLSNQLDLQAALDLKADISSLGAVAFSNDYNDLDNLPTIPTAQGLQDVITEDNVLTTDNSVDCNTFGFSFDDTSNFEVNSTNKLNINVNGESEVGLDSTSITIAQTSGTSNNQVLVDTNGVSIQGSDGTDTTSIGLEAAAIKVVTPDVFAGTASNGQVLTLVNAGTGEIEFTTVGGGGGGTVTSVALTMPTAFTVSGSPVTTSGTLAVSGAGTTDQYVRGDGTLANFPSTGGGGGQIFYFNGNIAEPSIGGNNYYQLGTAANTGAAANFTRATTGVIARFITSVGSPNHLLLPAGVWTIDVYLSETGGGSNHAQILAKLFTYDGTSFTLIATSTMEEITNGNVPDLYSFTISVPNTVTTSSDRIHIEFDIQNTNGKTVTLYTEDGKIGEVHTTYAIGLSSLNGLTANTQNFATGTSGTDFGISSAGSTHTFNLPTASATNRGALSSTDWSTFNAKQDALVSGTNIKTLEGQSLLGSGNIDLSKSDVGLSNVDNTSDLNKPISTATQTALNGKVDTTRTISTTSPLSGGGDLSANRTLSIADAVADGATKGAAAFTASDFNSASGVISIDYTNGQKATSSQPGFLTAADWTTFNTKVSSDYFTLRFNIANVAPADSQNYLLVDATPNLNTTGTLYRTTFPYACKLIGAAIQVINLVGNATTEASTINFRLNNSTDTLLSNAVVMSGAATTYNVYNVTGLSTSIAANDTAQVKWTTPAWVTNPSAVYLVVTCYFERT